jgi:hypothetical protein
VIVSHTVGGDEDACTIIAKLAMDKDSFLLTSQLNISKDRKKLRDLFVAWRIPAADWDIDEVHAQRLGALALPLALLRIFAAQIHKSW